MTKKTTVVRNSIVAGWFCFVVFGLPFVTCADDVDVRMLLRKSDTARGNTSGMEWTVAINLQDGPPEAEQRLRVQAKQGNSLVTFLAPPELEGQMLLLRNNTLWMIRPDGSAPVNVSPRQRLIGVASYADITSANYSGDYNARLTGTERVQNTECYVLELTGKTSKVAYDRIRYWISKDKNLGLKAHFYSVSGRLLKTAYFTYDACFTIGTMRRPFVSEIAIHDEVLEGAITMVVCSGIRKVKHLSNDDFRLETLLYGLRCVYETEHPALSRD